MPGHLPLSAFAADLPVECAGCGYIVVLRRDRLIERLGNLPLDAVAKRLRCTRCNGVARVISNTPKADGWPGSGFKITEMDVWRAPLPSARKG